MIGLTAVGWIHTAIGIVAIALGIAQIASQGEIRADNRPGKVFLALTALTAASALLLHQRAAFGPGHVLAVLALGAVGFGMIAGRGASAGSWRHVLSALAFSFTLVCQLIPGLGETLSRFPLGNPVASSVAAPELKPVFLGVVVGFLVLAVYQTVRLRKKRAES